MHTYIHTYMYAHIHTHVHAHIHTYIHTYTRACIHTYMHAHIHTHVHTYAGKGKSFVKPRHLDRCGTSRVYKMRKDCRYLTHRQMIFPLKDVHNYKQIDSYKFH